MAAPRMSKEDAIEVYAITMAYLSDASCDIAVITQTIHVMEMSPNVFYFWGQDVEQNSPIAICRYHQAEKRSTIWLMAGGRLTLLDEGSVWEVIDEDSGFSKERG